MKNLIIWVVFYQIFCFILFFFLLVTIGGQKCPDSVVDVEDLQDLRAEMKDNIHEYVFISVLLRPVVSGSLSGVHNCPCVARSVMIQTCRRLFQCFLLFVLPVCCQRCSEEAWPTYLGL